MYLSSSLSPCARILVSKHPLLWPLFYQTTVEMPLINHPEETSRTHPIIAIYTGIL